jgi:hypothetical protein
MRLPQHFDGACDSKETEQPQDDGASRTLKANSESLDFNPPIALWEKKDGERRNGGHHRKADDGCKVILDESLESRLKSQGNSCEI